VLACELLAVHQARRLAVGCPDPVLPTAGLRAELDALTEDLPAGVADRPFGRDVETLRSRLLNGG
jgi:histidine ammonia-lyase